MGNAHKGVQYEKQHKTNEMHICTSLTSKKEIFSLHHLIKLSLEELSQKITI